jgi:hypothetical protein
MLTNRTRMAKLAQTVSDHLEQNGYSS